MDIVKANSQIYTIKTTNSQIDTFKQMASYLNTQVKTSSGFVMKIQVQSIIR